MFVYQRLSPVIRSIRLYLPYKRDVICCFTEVRPMEICLIASEQTSEFLTFPLDNARIFKACLEYKYGPPPTLLNADFSSSSHSSKPKSLQASILSLLPFIFALWLCLFPHSSFYPFIDFTSSSFTTWWFVLKRSFIIAKLHSWLTHIFGHAFSISKVMYSESCLGYGSRVSNHQQTLWFLYTTGKSLEPTPES